MLPPTSYCLPADLLHDLLQQYVGVSLQLLSRMDVACCSHSMRPDWLTVLARMQLPSNYCSKLVHPACNYISWIASRGVHGAPLVIDAEEMAMQPSQPIVGIDTISLHSRSELTLNRSSILTFLACFPSLTAMDVTGWQTMTRKQLGAIQAGLQEKALKVLKLNAECFSAKAIADTVAVTAMGLQELCLTAITRDDEAKLLKLLTQHCHRLQMIELDFEEICEGGMALNHPPTAQLVFDLCMSSKDGLEKLTVMDYNDLTSLASVLQNLAKNCPRLTSFQGYLVEFTFSTDSSSGTRVCDIEIGQCGSGAAWLEGYCRNDSDEVSVPIRKYLYRTMEEGYCLDERDILLLAECGGQYLQTLDCMLDSDNNGILDAFSDRREALTVMFTSCPNLTSLGLHGCFASMNSKMVVALPAHCPNITSLTSLELTVSTASEESIVSMLTAYRGKLQVLVLAGGAQLSNTTLIKITELFPTMQELGLNTTCSNAENVLVELILAGKFQVMKIFWKNPEGRVIRDRLTKAGHRPLPRVYLAYPSV